MAVALSDQLSGIQTPAGGAGLAGGTVQVRAADNRGKMRIKRWSFTIPASGAGSASGDSVDLATLFVTDRLIENVVYIPALGAATTIDLGKRDDNNSTNTSATRYAGAVASVVASRYAASTNMLEEVGTDPAGDLSTGNTPPGFGSKPIVMTLTIHGTPTAGVVLNGYLMYTAE